MTTAATHASPDRAAAAHAMRSAGARDTAAALIDARRLLLRQFDAYQAALGARGLAVPYAGELNPPLWELGHVGWFEEYWIARNPQRHLGVACDPRAVRAAPLRTGADALYDSSEVAHARRWQLDLPDARHTLADLLHIRECTMAALQRCDEGDDAAMYFFRLALFHEDMHREAWVYMAQNLGFAPGIDATAPQPASPRTGSVAMRGGTVELGSAPGGFAFDNELGRHEQTLAPYEIDAAPLSWAHYVQFIEAGGYADQRQWSAAGWAWRQHQAAALPRYLQRDGAGGWCRLQFGELVPLDLAQPAMNLTHHEASAWCRWADRRLPTEAEWEHAATTHSQSAFAWGQVWEWTASAFAPYPGFTPHPYRDYSAPWFDGRPVLRGASFATVPRMQHARYRNYFSAERNDLFAGFRSCAV